MVKTNHIRKKEDDNEQKYKRMQFLVVVFLFCIAVIIGQLFRFQIIKHEFYLAKKSKKKDDNEQKYKRMQFLVVVFLFCIAVINGQLFRIQIIEHEVYLAKE